MHLGKTVFAQLMEFIPAHEFRRCVNRYRGNRKVSSFSCWDQFLSMAFAQLTYRESLRDIETCLRALGSRLYHLGLRGRVSRSTLADANETRDYRIYADLAQVLIATARPLYAGEDFGVDLEQTVYALDCTTIDLCLSLFPWARYRAHNAAVKLHTLLDLEGNIPAFIDVKPAKIHEIHVLDELLPEPGSIYIMDRAYLDFERLYRLHQALAFFIIRPRKDFRFHRLAAHPVDKLSGLRCDQTIRLKSFYPAQFYPDSLRRIRYCDAETEKTLVFLTNNFLLPTLTITQLYRCRWQVELFFKWVKQHLRIKTFYGLSPKAVHGSNSFEQQRRDLFHDGDARLGVFPGKRGEHRGQKIRRDGGDHADTYRARDRKPECWFNLASEGISYIFSNIIIGYTKWDKTAKRTRYVDENKSKRL